MQISPIYTRENCRFSFPLQWGLTIFWRTTQLQCYWLEDLTATLEQDGIRVLSHRFLNDQASQFAISTKPHVAPQTIVQRVKGRLQYIVREDHPKPFQRNFAIRSFGEEQRGVIENYVENQTKHHPYADPQFQRFLEGNQIEDESIDLSTARSTSHGLFWYNLHLVIVNQERWRSGDERILAKIREMILKVGSKNNWLISRGGILPDHIHLALGCSFDVAPDEVAFSFLNNLAHAYEMKPVFQFGAYIGTFGEYDQRAVTGSR